MQEVYYCAKSWNKQRRIIGKAEYNHKGDNKRFIITTLSESSEMVYKNVYCPRGNMENKNSLNYFHIEHLVMNGGQISSEYCLLDYLIF